MKYMLSRKIFAFAVVFFIGSFYYCSAQNKTTGLTESQVMDLVNNKQFQFLAQYMVPSGGRSKVLTDNYTVNVSPEEVSADLPYVGRAYNAPMDPADVGIRFVSKDFTYEEKKGKKDSWEITISPKDGKDVRSCQFTVYSNGNANLMVSSNNRQPISYSGVITTLVKKAQ
jgi:hypothetical protein